MPLRSPIEVSLFRVDRHGGVAPGRERGASLGNRTPRATEKKRSRQVSKSQRGTSAGPSGGVIAANRFSATPTKPGASASSQTVSNLTIIPLPHHGARTALTLKKRLVVEVPYVPGRAAVQFIRSTLDSRMMLTGPPESAGITTAVLGVKVALDEQGVTSSTVQNTGMPYPQAAKEIVAGPATTGAGGVVEPPETFGAPKLTPLT